MAASMTVVSGNLSAAMAAVGAEETMAAVSQPWHQWRISNGRKA